mmetsp:Transcript_114684/g.228203  ORF Transcript_114684/g.228203 Transcript_114684/m.228203 type:complete len:231 (-) Transcript_114684:356-1048(-)
MDALQTLGSSSCVIDSVMATLSLTNAGSAVKDALADCGHRNETLCAADAASIVGALSGVGSFLSSAVYQCSDKRHVGAQCAKCVLALTQALARFVKSASLTSISCTRSQQQSKEMVHEHLAGRSLFTCIVDAAHSAYSLSLAGSGVLSASKSCEGGQQHNCSTDALNIVASLVHSAGFIATAVNDCRPHERADAHCAIHVSSLMGSLSMIASMAYSMVDGCNATLLHGHR